MFSFNKMLSLIILFGFFHFSSSYTLIQPRQSSALNETASLISSEHCQFYTALNTQLQCGPKSHLIQFSYKYCQLLLSIRNTFENTQYQDNTRRCLQEKLLAKIQKLGEAKVTCDTFKEIDLESHGSCLSIAFKQLSVNDVKQFLAVFKDTTVNFPQLCKMANGFAGHWSQLVKGDLMLFVKKQLKEIFPEGDTSKCTIKVKDIIDEIGEIVSQVGTVLDKIKGAKDDIVLIVEKAKAIRDDLKAIGDIGKQMENGTVSKADGLKQILAKSKAITANAKLIIETIKNLGKDKKNTGDEQPATGEGKKETEQESLALMQLSQILGKFNALKEEIYKIIDNVNSIIDTIDEIRDGKKDVADGLVDIIGKIEEGIDSIYAIIDTSYALKESVFELVESFSAIMEGVVGGLVGGAQETLGEIGGSLPQIGGSLPQIGI